MQRRGWPAAGWTCGPGTCAAPGWGRSLRTRKTRRWVAAQGTRTHGSRWRVGNAYRPSSARRARRCVRRRMVAGRVTSRMRACGPASQRGSPVRSKMQPTRGIGPTRLTQRFGFPFLLLRGALLPLLLRGARLLPTKHAGELGSGVVGAQRNTACTRPSKHQCSTQA